MDFSLEFIRKRKLRQTFKFVIWIIVLAISPYLYFIHRKALTFDSQFNQNSGFEIRQRHLRKLSEFSPSTDQEKMDQDKTGKMFETRFPNNILYTNSSTKGDTQMHELNRHKPHRSLSNWTVQNMSARYRRLPRALIIGVKKCGTRALLEYLRIHPDVKAPGPEPHFFDKYYHLGMDWYREQMPRTYDHQITMEKTPRYFVNSDAPYRIWSMSSSIKIIVVVRNPVTRAISDFTQGATKQHYLFSSVFKRKAFRSNGTGEVNTHWSLINTGLYAQHLQRWLKYFPLRQMYFVSGENLILNPAREMEGVQDFLGITRVINDYHFYFNATKGFPCINTLSLGSSAKCFNHAKGRHHLDLDEDTLTKLKKFYTPFNAEFYALVGKNFGW